MKHRFILSIMLVLTLMVFICGSPAMAAAPCEIDGCTCTLCSTKRVNYRPDPLYGKETHHMYDLQCTKCSAQVTVAFTEAHTFSGNRCTKCGYTKSCSHGSTTTSWSGCKYTKKCTSCGATVSSGYSHNYTYGTWSYYSVSQHKRTGTCSKCGTTTTGYENHSTAVQYSQYNETQHKMQSYCSVCSHTVGSEGYANHSFTYGTWTDYDDDQHRRTKECTPCSYSTYEFGDHVDANGDDLCDVCKHLMTRFSVTVPTSMAMAVSPNGAVYAAENAQIVNNSTGAVRLTGLKIAADNGWQLIPFARDLAGTKVDSKQIGFRIAGCDTLLQGTQEQLDITNLGNVPKDSSLSLPYAAVVSAMSQPVNEQVLTVEFTVDWAA